MFRKFPVLFLLLFAFPLLASEEEGIRHLDIPTLEYLGKELYKRDQLAWKATDALMALPEEKRNLPITSWVTELGTAMDRVHFFLYEDGKFSQGIVVEFVKGQEPIIRNNAYEPLEPHILTRIEARITGIKAIPGFYDMPYNFEVLNDPDGKGFIVYSMVATINPDEIIMGGHTRVTVSADGKTAERVDALSKSLLILEREPKDTPESYTHMGKMCSHIVSPTPIETHIFVSLQEEQPLMVVTNDNKLWEVRDGKMKVKLEDYRTMDMKPAN